MQNVAMKHKETKESNLEKDCLKSTAVLAGINESAHDSSPI